jgi:hypothetical protein
MVLFIHRHAGLFIRVARNMGFDDWVLAVLSAAVERFDLA